jgi:hypothetical protein
MQVAERSIRRASGRLGLSLVVAILAMGCRFRSPGAYWIEAHGEGRAVRLAGRPAGVASAAVYVISPNGEVVRVVDGRGTAYAGSVGWGSSAIAASEDDRLFVVVGGRTRQVDGADLKDAPCGSVAATAIAAAGGDEIYVVDGVGALYRGTANACAPVATPTPLRDVAAFPGRVVAVGRDGTVWRRRGEQPWQPLPAAVEYRPGGVESPRPAVQAALSATCTWLLDQDGAVFVLSDET